MKSGIILKRFTAKDGREVILRTIQENELENARRLFKEIFGEDKYLLSTLVEKHQRHPSLFIGCFDEERIVGTVFGWPDPGMLVVKAIAVLETYRRKGIGTALLKLFDKAAMEEGFENFVLGARWEAVPFYMSYGLGCFANVQIKPDEIPWARIQELQSKYDIISGVVFGSPKLSKLISKLNKELTVNISLSNSDSESVSIQMTPKEVSKGALEKMEKDFNAYSTQFCFKKKL